MKRAKASSRQIVGISSRCQQDQFQWMIDMFASHLSELVTEVKYYPITNENSDEWKKEVKGCSFGILYHSLKHGRINITDVEGSLYDKELLYMSQCLDKENVMVVLDDLEQTTEEETKRILRTQPSIKHCSSLLLLTAKKDKENYFLFQIDAISPLLNTVKSRSSSAFAIKNTSSTEARSLLKSHSSSLFTYPNFSSPEARSSGDFTENRAQPRMTPVAAECVSAQQLMLKIEDLKKEMSNQTQQIKDLKKEMSNQTQHIEDLKKEMSNKTHHIEDLKKEMSNRTQHIEDLKKEMSNRTQKTEELKKELPNQDQQIDKLNKQDFQQSQL
ncbi:reticulocyte-binding protein 2 homolog a-like [Xenopus laevis]|uniref:Reticulocyte-binding protein 2 homolog a-like n=1 Tax=Xenopus laevis TaxID=8355 RepID=A0A8J1LQF3_XENLA|nr:reticulocyte-binding protein 2 homolog a-like [Xenopus laevis]